MHTITLFFPMGVKETMDLYLLHRFLFYSRHEQARIKQGETLYVGLTISGIMNYIHIHFMHLLYL